MRQWFPFTDYDFFAHMFCGALLLSGLDYGFNGGQFLAKTGWPPLQAAVGVALVYIVGLTIAQISSFVIERGICEKFLYPTTLLQLNGRKPRWRERLLFLPFAGRECRALSAADIHSQRLRELPDKEAALDANRVFQIGLTKSLEVESLRSRLSIFQNQYGLSRNLSLTFLCLGVVFLFSISPKTHILSGISFIMSLSMLGRFFKFYAAYSREAFRKLG